MKSLRLNTVLNYINKEDKLADVGCDHGYLLLGAINKGITLLQAIENKKGPLSSTQLHLNNYNYSQNLEIIYSLSDGLDQLDNRIDTIAICGLGGYLIIDIINKNLSKAKKLKKLILEANNHENDLRKFLMDNNFRFINEEIIIDNNKYYQIMVVEPTLELINFDNKDLIFGPVLRQKKSTIFKNKWIDKANEIKFLLETKELSLAKKKELTNLYQMINEELF